MHEQIRVAHRRMTCDLCGLSIHPGERYRAVIIEYSPMIYHEHIRCPGGQAEATGMIRPIPPKHETKFNHAVCMA